MNKKTAVCVCVAKVTCLKNFHVLLMLSHICM